MRYHVGGGITWSSDAKSEDEETLLKGERLAAALEPEPSTTTILSDTGHGRA